MFDPSRRPAILAATLAAVALLATEREAAAQSPCAPAYVMKPGDTLYQVTQACRVSLPELLRANPGIDDIDDIPVGTRIAMPGDAPPDSGGRDDAPSASPSIDLQPLAGAPGAPVTVRGQGLEPGSTVTIGAGPPQSEWDPLAEAEVGRNGSVESQVEIPQHAKPGRELVFVIHTPGGRTLVSRELDVVDRRDPDAGMPPGGEDADGARSFEGRVAAGVECPVLETDDGTTYSLAGADAAAHEGGYVRVTGTMASMSICMQGEGTISVSSLEEIAPPR